MISAGTLGTALLWSLAASLITWIALYPARRRSLTGLFASVVLTGTAASVGALLGGVHEMLLPMQHWEAMLGLTLAAGAIATAAATLAARRVGRDNREVHAAIATLAAGHVPPDSPRQLTAELDSLRAELTKTAQTLAATREREEALESSRRELVAWVSHDLRTPLAGLRAMAEALEDGVVDDPTTYYKQIVASTDRLSSMVDDLFELSRLHAGVMSLETEPVTLADLVSDCIASLAPLAQSRGVTLVGTASTTATLAANPSQLSRAVTNLIVNAIRHTASGGKVEVRVDSVDGAAVVEVADECGGIPQADLARLFDVGFRGEAARTPDDGAHAGLGLAIADGIVQAHRGTIAVRNEPPGCIFTITLPV